MTDQLLYNESITLRNRKFVLRSPTSCKKELNILLLGETGVGKSTWINGFANYINFPTLTEAETNDWVHLIPTAFTMTDENHREKLISIGTDDNEDREVGQSATQSPRTYRFSNDDVTVRLIDTPGVGDTRGIDQDKENFRNILSHIARYNTLNGICILLKPNNARLDITFKYCIKELLANLHKDARHNIVFCFTNARSTLYRPGDTLTPLRKLLEESKADIDTNNYTMYCIDNEAVRYLAAVKAGVTFSREHQLEFCKSWVKSVMATDRLIEHIAERTPHLIKDMLTINNARRMINGLIRPLAMITANIQENLSAIANKKSDLDLSENNLTELRTKLHITISEPKPIPLKTPQKVCKARKCMKEFIIGDVIKTDYACSRDLNRAQNPFHIRRNKSKQCKMCGCDKSEHGPILYEDQRVQRRKDLIQKELADKEIEHKDIANALKVLEENERQLQAEQTQILDSSAQFAYFLKFNAITPFNDTMINYLEYYKSTFSDRHAFERMEKICERYAFEVATFEAAIKAANSPTAAPSPEKVKTLIDELYALKHVGRLIKDVVTVAEAADGDALKASEVVVESKRQPDTPTQNILERLKSPQHWQDKKGVKKKK